MNKTSSRSTGMNKVYHTPNIFSFTQNKLFLCFSLSELATFICFLGFILVYSLQLSSFPTYDFFIYFFFAGVFLAGVLLLDRGLDLLAERFGVLDLVPVLPLGSGEVATSGAESPATREDLRGC